MSTIRIKGKIRRNRANVKITGLKRARPQTPTPPTPQWVRLAGGAFGFFFVGMTIYYMFADATGYGR